MTNERLYQCEWECSPFTDLSAQYANDVWIEDVIIDHVYASAYPYRLELLVAVG